LEDHLGASLEALQGAVSGVLDAAIRDHKTPLTNERGLSRAGDVLFVHPDNVPDWCVFFGDIDDFKTLNSRLLYDGADTVLHAVGSALGRIEEAYGFRRGGDEFVLVTEYARAQEVISAIERELSPIKLTIEGYGEVEAYTSFGYSRMNPTLSFQENMSRAEDACKAAKWNHKNTPVEWTPDLPKSHSARLRCPDCRSQFSISICPERSDNLGPLHCMACKAELPTESSTVTTVEG
jgi:diguanylate cyclase (GGDEF)-like protein